MRSDPLHAATADLRALGGGRVWSLMVSLFGDLAQGKGESIDGPVLSVIMAALDVRPEAARVALHRLRNDGWIASEKQGRISQHSLTAKGREESAAASPRIYAAPDAGSEIWHLVLLPAAKVRMQKAMLGLGFVQLTPRVFIGATAQDLPEDALAFAAQDAPDWLRKQVSPSALEEEYDDLRRALRALKTVLPDDQRLAPIDAAVLRCLVVHNWRRLVLRHPQPPRGLVDRDSAYHQCHVLVADLLARHPRPALADLAP